MNHLPTCVNDHRDHRGFDVEERIAEHHDHVENDTQAHGTVTA